MTKLNQIIAIEKGVKATAEQAFVTAHRDVQKSDPLSGISRSYTPRDEDGLQLPAETKLPQIRATEVIDRVTGQLTRLFDVTATKDAANCEAKADVVVDGRTILPGVTVTTLLFLERKLGELQTFITKLPVLDPAERWSYSPDVGAYASAPAQTVRSKKVMRNWVKAEATEHHPAQVDVYTEDVPEGTWTTVKYSGALPADRVGELLARVQKLTEAVKQAREEANSIEITDTAIGAPFFAYLFGER
ncbi:DUF7873 family protein [Kineosporia babensis]|uniref:Uncharacterized protein n=1 Tax=Kineosporia babensis TaxID=499548 RepID=A0A9X1NNQ5_9ACTN|nr:hypothetical protein [Kineosporia babensis]MCD5316443.1 hypothetical protein [Kineosporia babensis]